MFEFAKFLITLLLLIDAEYSSANGIKTPIVKPPLSLPLPLAPGHNPYINSAHFARFPHVRQQLDPYADSYQETYKPYSFGYSVPNHYSKQHRQETQLPDGTVTGSYGYVDANNVYRVVEYIADQAGFRARIRTSEPGVGNQSPADVELIKEPEPPIPPYPLGGGFSYGQVINHDVSGLAANIPQTPIVRPRTSLFGTRYADDYEPPILPANIPQTPIVRPRTSPFGIRYAGDYESPILPPQSLPPQYPLSSYLNDESSYKSYYSQFGSRFGSPYSPPFSPITSYPSSIPQYSARYPHIPYSHPYSHTYSNPYSQSNINEHQSLYQNPYSRSLNYPYSHFPYKHSSLLHPSFSAKHTLPIAPRIQPVVPPVVQPVAQPVIPPSVTPFHASQEIGARFEQAPIY